MTTTPYQLTASDIGYDADDDLPVVRAARNPNPSVLAAVLAYGASFAGARTHPGFSAGAGVNGAIFRGLYTSPLLTALTHRLPQNVSILLSAGADPNELLLHDPFDSSARHMLRRDLASGLIPTPSDSDALETLQHTQHAPLSGQEFAERERRIARWWAEPVRSGPLRDNEPAKLALTLAAELGDVENYEQLRAAGADESYWTSGLVGSEDSPSALSVGTPLHAALTGRHSHMLQHLLSLGYDPNCVPAFAAPTFSVPPSTFALIFCEPPFWGGYNILAAHAATNLDVRTPAFGAHILHFAAAKLDLDMLKALWKEGRPNPAGTTALGHSLLHIACMPHTDVEINVFAPGILQSVHDVRTLSRYWRPFPLSRQVRANRVFDREPADTTPLPHPNVQRDEPRRAELVLWLLERGIDPGVRDRYGNTALHYLAALMCVPLALVGLMRDYAEENLWEEARNKWGWTPEELWKDGCEAEKGPFAVKQFWSGR